MILRAAVLTAMLCMLQAGPAGADPFTLGQTAVLSSSERLRIFALGRALETGAAVRAQVELLRRDMVGQGFYHDSASPAIISHRSSIQPQLGYDPNINGGFHVWQLYMGDWVLEAPEDARAQPAFTLGAGGSAEARMAWAEGRFISANLSAGAAWAPELDIGRNHLRAELCSRNHLVGWTFLDLCAEATRSDRKLGRSESGLVSAQISRITAFGGGYHELSAGLGRRMLQRADQNILTFGWGAIWDSVATEVSVTLGAPAGDTFALRHRVTAEARWRTFGHASVATIWHERVAGGTFLGEARADDSLGVSLAQSVTPRVSLSVGAMQTRSSVDFFSYEQILLAVNFTPIEF